MSCFLQNVVFFSFIGVMYDFLNLESRMVRFFFSVSLRFFRTVRIIGLLFLTVCTEFKVGKGEKDLLFELFHIISYHFFQFLFSFYQKYLQLL